MSTGLENLSFRAFLRPLALAGLLACLCLLCQQGCPSALAEEARPLADDPVAEKRLQAISSELRCLVCQNETIASSNADLAQDLRREIRAKIQAGESDQEIIDFMVAHYGDFVRYRPPFKSSTALLWLGPLVFFLLGLTALLLYLKRRGKRLQTTAPLSEDEARRAEILLAEPPSSASQTTPKAPS